MNFFKDIKISPMAAVFLCYLVIFMCHALSVSAYIDNKVDSQTETLVEIKTEQEQIITRIEKVDNEVTELQTTTTSFNSIIDDVQQIKDTTYEIKFLEYQTEMSALSNIEDKEKWFLEYMDICERYKDYIQMPTTIYDVLTEEELDRFFCMVQTEIGSGTFDSKVNVADVVWNRMEDPIWPNTILEIIKPGQFAFSNTKVTESTRLAVEYSFMFPDQTNGALAFHSMGKSERFGGYYYLFTDINGHNFYGPKVEE